MKELNTYANLSTEEMKNIHGGIIPVSPSTVKWYCAAVGGAFVWGYDKGYQFGKDLAK
ncbi:class IIb bacteriocin, lactobin A/cerein 7B family [Leuconostoc suionicum]|uniref:class IIb bacteriocin, lactobin A/cerein 7B family n=1 Tax=Leuconostoc suionicum TaxID=1511761 RepID=UPI00233F002F|nr:class IIb bacteriocin, lactobin A/cerein 7B family [Leuconostoc suionicum]MDC2806831.1 class IIb bacteriocin, lactobin A/cerein 7B family [Leuconostoc suionicum]MDC2824343.1 class IIb bacteriocin, lactobin A/cerein 7B family [Leuconostoc suionicum]